MLHYYYRLLPKLEERDVPQEYEIEYPDIEWLRTHTGKKCLHSEAMKIANEYLVTSLTMMLEKDRYIPRDNFYINTAKVNHDHCYISSIGGKLEADIDRMWRKLWGRTPEDY